MHFSACLVSEETLNSSDEHSNSTVKHTSRHRQQKRQDHLL